MTTRSRAAPGTTGKPASPLRPFRSLLVPCDLTSIADRVIGRVARLPLADDARITLLHVLPDELPVRIRQREEDTAHAALDDAVRTLTRRLPAHQWIHREVKVGTAATAIARRAASLQSELIVMGVGGQETLRRMFIGSTAERVIRRTRTPVLVVRHRPGSSYQRPAIAVDTEGGAPESVVALLRLLADSPSVIDAIHAFEMPYDGLVYRQLLPEGREAYLGRLRRRATRMLMRALTVSLAGTMRHRQEAPTWRPHVEGGSPRRVITAAVKEARTDLLVLGSRAHTGASRALLGTVAGDVLRSVACDVLVVPCRGRTPDRS